MEETVDASLWGNPPLLNTHVRVASHYVTPPSATRTRHLGPQQTTAPSTLHEFIVKEKQSLVTYSRIDIHQRKEKKRKETQLSNLCRHSTI